MPPEASPAPPATAPAVVQETAGSEGDHAGERMRGNCEKVDGRESPWSLFYGRHEFFLLQQGDPRVAYLRGRIAENPNPISHGGLVVLPLGPRAGDVFASSGSAQRAMVMVMLFGILTGILAILSASLPVRVDLARRCVEFGEPVFLGVFTVLHILSMLLLVTAAPTMLYLSLKTGTDRCAAGVAQDVARFSMRYALLYYNNKWLVPVATGMSIATGVLVEDWYHVIVFALVLPSLPMLDFAGCLASSSRMYRGTMTVLILSFASTWVFERMEGSECSLLGETDADLTTAVFRNLRLSMSLLTYVAIVRICIQKIRHPDAPIFLTTRGAFVSELRCDPGATRASAATYELSYSRHRVFIHPWTGPHPSDPDQRRRPPRSRGVLLIPSSIVDRSFDLPDDTEGGIGPVGKGVGVAAADAAADAGVARRLGSSAGSSIVITSWRPRWVTVLSTASTAGAGLIYVGAAIVHILGLIGAANMSARCFENEVDSATDRWLRVAINISILGLVWLVVVMTCHTASVVVDRRTGRTSFRAALTGIPKFILFTLRRRPTMVAASIVSPLVGWLWLTSERAPDPYVELSALVVVPLLDMWAMLFPKKSRIELLVLRVGVIATAISTMLSYVRFSLVSSIDCANERKTLDQIAAKIIYTASAVIWHVQMIGALKNKFLVVRAPFLPFEPVRGLSTHNAIATAGRTGPHRGRSANPSSINEMQCMSVDGVTAV